MIETKIYPEEPGAKFAGTSTEAAVAIKKKAPTLRADVLLILKGRQFNGCTADEAAAIMGESVLSIRPRFSELLEMGLIKDSGCRRNNASGRAATVWLAVTPSEQKRLF